MCRYLWDQLASVINRGCPSLSGMAADRRLPGNYQKALDDCNASLANGSIPDAFKKKEELVAKLSH